MDQKNSLYVALGGLALLIILYALTSLELLGPNPIGSTSRATAPLLVPAPWAFSVWGPIYIGLIVFPIFQFFKQRTGHPAWIEVRKWYAANVVANGVWLVLASYDVIGFTVVVIAFMLHSLLKINTLLNQVEGDGGEVNYWGERFVFYIYFAWITLATVLNVSTDFKTLGYDGAPLSEAGITMVMIIITSLIAGLAAWRFRSAAYCGVVVWAFSALAVKHGGSIPSLFYTSILVAVVFSVLAVACFTRGRDLSLVNI